MMPKKLGSVVIAVVATAMACSDPSGPRASVTEFGGPVAAVTDEVNGENGFVYPSGMTAGEVRLCKYVPVGDPAGVQFTFQVTVTSVLPAPGAISDNQVQVEGIPGQSNCVDVPASTKNGSGLDKVVIVESAPPANWAMTAINTVRIDDGPGYTPPDLPTPPEPVGNGDYVVEDVGQRRSVVYINNDMGRIVTFTNDYTPPAAGAVLLIIDEDGIDNGLHFNKDGGPIVPSGPNFFSVLGVNDDKPDKKQRDVLRYFANNVGRTITVRTGQTGDEGWFAPNCIPAKFIASNNKENNSCLTNGARQAGINNYFGVPTESAVPEQERLDKVPHVIPLRALGLNALIGKTVCAVVYDSDVSINYDHDKPDMGVNGNLQGETLGVVAFDVNQVLTLNGFSSSTLPQVTITIRSTSVCGNWVLFRAPVPKSSSVPNDRIAPGSTYNYKYPNQPPVFF